MSWIIYILRLSNNSLYTGITNNLENRIKAHKSGKGSKYVRSYYPFSVVYVERTTNRSDASKIECKIKKLSKKDKEQLVSEYKRRMDMSFPIEPLFDRVFIKKDDAQTTKSGLHLPETVKGRATTGTVMAVGPGQRNHLGDYITPCVKVGDRVYIKEFYGYIIKYNEHEVFVFNENEILGIVKDQEYKG